MFWGNWVYLLPKGVLFLAKCEKGKGALRWGLRCPAWGCAGGNSGEGAALRVRVGTWPQRLCYLFPFGKDIPFCKCLRGLGCDGVAMNRFFCLLPPLCALR